MVHRVELVIGMYQMVPSVELVIEMYIEKSWL